MITLVATLCLMMVCQEEIVTDSNMDAGLNWMSCQMAEPGLAQWIRDNPKYQGWHLAKWKCVPGHYNIPGRA